MKLQQFEDEIRYQKQYLSDILALVEKWQVEIIAEEDIPMQRLTIMRCGENRPPGKHAKSVFTDFKLNRLFDSKNVEKL